jgi:hypothetical protein
VRNREGTTSAEEVPSLFTLIIQLLSKKGGEATSLELLEVLSQQRGVTQNSLVVLLTEMEEQGQVTLKETIRGMFKCHKVRLLPRFSIE